MWLRKLKPRFGLRTLLVLVTGLAVLLGWGAHFVRKVRRTNEIVARLEARDEVVFFGPTSFLGIECDGSKIPGWAWSFFGEATFRTPRRLSLSDINGLAYTEAEFAEIGELSGLTQISFSCIDLPPSRMETLAQLENLDTIELDRIEIHDDRLGRLASLPNLWGFELIDGLSTSGRACVSDETLLGLSQLRSLHSLKLSGCGSAGSKGAQALRNLTQLEHLVLEGRSSFMHEVLLIVDDLPNLRTLAVREGTVNLEAAEMISRQDQIESLDFFGSYVEEGSLGYLKALPRLKQLWVGDVTDRGVLDIVQCAELEDVHIYGDKLTSEALLHLATLRKLGRLNISADLDYEAVLGLSKVLSACSITYTGGNGTVIYRGGVKVR